MSKVQIPSVQLDLVREDLGDATQASLLSGNAETYALSDGMTLLVSIDGGGAQTVTFYAVDFDLIAEATADEVAAILNSVAGLAGATSEDDGGKVRITSDSWGSGSSVQVTGGTANAVLGFSTSAVTGSDFTPIVQLINRIPEDDEVGVPLDSDIVFDLHDGDGSAPGLATVSVWVGGVLAVSAGVAQAGYAVSSSLPDAATRRVTVNPDDDFDSAIDIDVRVTESGSSLDETYTFTTKDILPPRVATAEARTRQVVRVTFNEAVKQVSAANSNDALNPANYAFTRLAVPTVGVEVVSVSQVEPADPTSVDLTVNIEMSFNAPYQIVVTGVEDIYGNEIAAPYNAVEFTTLEAPFPAGRRFRLIEFVPNLNRLEDQTGELELWILIKQDVVDLLLCTIDEWLEILDPDVAPERFLDAMLEDLGNPFFFVDLTEIDKRRLLRVLVDIYKAKGTKQGIIDVVRFFTGLTITIEIYNGLGFELAHEDNPTLDGQSPPSGPGDELSSAATEAPGAGELGPGERRLLYSFEVHSAIELTDEQRDRIVDIVELMKPAHTHLTRIVEPTTAETYDHLELGISELGKTGGPAGSWELH
jgi:phage tail-like protein